MKNLFLALSMLLSTVALAETEIMIYDTNEYVLSAKQELKVNIEMNRAWVEITTYAHEEDVGYAERVKVPGLTYDPQARAIVFESEGQLVECAKIKQTRLFKNIRVVETGSCEFSRKDIIKKVDDGFEVKRVNITQFFLTVK